MKIERITVSAGRTFNHPYESYSNLKPAVTLEATLGDADNPDERVDELQQAAEGMVERHKDRLLGQLEEIEKGHQALAMASLLEKQLEMAEKQIATMKEQLERARRGEVQQLTATSCATNYDTDGLDEEPPF